MKKQLRILHLEDDPCDVELVRDVLRRKGLSCEINAVSAKKDFLAALEGGPVDVILSDNSIPGFDGMNALKVARDRHVGVPFIFLSGALETRQRDRQMAAGASGCLVKTELSKLAELIIRSLADDEQRTPVLVPPVMPAASDWYLRAMEKLVGVIQELSLSRDLPRIMEIVRRSARELTGADGATFVLRDGDKCHYADEDAIAPLWKGLRFPMSVCVSGWAMVHRESVVIEDIYSDPRVPVDAYRPTFVKSLVMVPIRQKEPVGAIGTYWAVRRQPRPEEVRLLQALADSTSVAMENVQLYSSLEQKVRDRTTRLEAANQELEAFSSSVSHDLRAPLRHVSSYIEMLREDPDSKLSPDGERFAGVASDAARRMGRLIDELLEFARMGRTEMMQDRVNTNELVAEVIRELHTETENRTIFWNLADLPEVTGDRALLKQAWANLLSNAVKYTSKRERAEIHVGATPAEGGWEFSIRDNGAGFDNEYVGRLFGVFQRLHTANEFEGTGVGLANVRRIIARHGGRTWAEGQPDKGATFYFFLPAI